AWIVIGVIAGGLAALVWRVFRPERRRTVGGADARGAWDPRWNRLVLCYGGFGVGYIIPATFLPVMGKHVIRHPAGFGWAWALFGVAAAVSAVSLAALPRTTNRRAWIVGHLVMASGIALPVIWPGLAAIMLAALAVGGTFMIITMAGLQEARAAGGVH